MAVLDQGKQLDYAKWVLERNLGWIAQAEVKVAVLVSLNVAIAGALAAAFASADVHTCVTKGLTVLSAALLFIGAICAVVTVRPNVSNPKPSYVFFGKIIEGRTSSQFAADFKGADEEALLNDLLDHVYKNAEIAAAKHKWIKRGIDISQLGAIAAVPAIALLVKF